MQLALAYFFFWSFYATNFSALKGGTWTQGRSWNVQNAWVQILKALQRRQEKLLQAQAVRKPQMITLMLSDPQPQVIVRELVIPFKTKAFDLQDLDSVV